MPAYVVAKFLIHNPSIMDQKIPRIRKPLKIATVQNVLQLLVGCAVLFESVIIGNGSFRPAIKGIHFAQQATHVFVDIKICLKQHPMRNLQFLSTFIAWLSLVEFNGTEMPATYESDPSKPREHDMQPVFVGPNHNPEVKWETCRRCGFTRKPSPGSSYLCYSNLDDQPITEEWLREFAARIQGVSLMFVPYGIQIEWWEVDPLKIKLQTRRDVRLLCDLLKITLKEPE